jgi:primary-amine oxidase
MRRVATTLAALLSLAGAAHAQAPTHPLDGLSAREHWTVRDALVASGRTDSTTQYLYVGLHEPDKSEVLAWRAGQSFRRAALVHLVQSGQGIEAIVDINAKSVLAWSDAPGQQYMTNDAEAALAERLALADSGVREGITRRGITDWTLVGCGPANHGYFDLPEERGRRVVHVTCGTDQGRILGYGESFEGLVAVVDLTEKKVLRVVDTGARPSSGPVGDFEPEAIGPTRTAPNRVAMIQPGGPSYTLDGHQVNWQNWKFQFRVDPRRGVIVSQVRYADGGRDRSIMYQGSLSELFVPYMDANAPWSYQGFFDLGTYPAMFGGIASSLERGIECPDYATYFDAWVARPDGRPRQRPRAACLFERNAGDVAWRHGIERGNTIEARPKTDLVLRMYMTAGNYDYLFDWVFQQDGTLKIDASATGMDATKTAAGTAADEQYGRLIAPGLVGMNHSHFFSFRIDLDVDGTANSLHVDQLRTQRLPADNPRRSVWTAETVEARTEREGMRMSTMAAPERWRIVNPAVKGPYSGFVGYQIDSHSAMPLLAADDYMLQRAGFTEHMLWVTPYDRKQLYASGDYPTVHPAGEGLPAWTADNASIVNQDLVAWVTMGFHHIPRPEDWPLMPVAKHSMEIRPVGFFARNPAMDLPKP